MKKFKVKVEMRVVDLDMLNITVDAETLVDAKAKVFEAIDTRYFRIVDSQEVNA